MHRVNIIGLGGALLLASCSGSGTATDTGPEAMTPGTSNDGGAPGADGSIRTPEQVDAAPGTDSSTPPPDGSWAPPTETGNVAFPYTAYRCGYPVRQVSPSKPAAAFHGDMAVMAPKNLHLTFAGDPSTSVVIQWSTDDASTATEVRFGESAQTLNKIAHGFSFTYGVPGRRQHELHLCGLEAGRTYYYDAGGGTMRSAVHHFVTAPANATDVKVLVIGDTRTDPTIFAQIAPKGLAEAPDVMILSGDAVADGGNQSEWDQLFAAGGDLLAEVPSIWAHGNHEGLDELYFAQLALPDNGGAEGVEEWFATTYGPIRFVVLNDTVKTAAQITGVEKTFLSTTLAALDRARTPFAVAMHHQPLWTTSSGHASNTTLRSAWGPLFEQYHVNVDVAGHVHSYESTHPLKGGVVVPDAQGTRYFNFGGGGAPLYGFAATQPWILTRESVHGYAIVTASPTSMKWVAHRADGTTIETIDLPK